MKTDYNKTGKIADRLFQTASTLERSVLTGRPNLSDGNVRAIFNYIRFTQNAALAASGASHEKSTSKNGGNLNQLAMELKGVITHVQKTLLQLSFQRDVDLTQFWALQLMCVKKVVKQLSDDLSQEVSAASTSYGVEPKKVAQAIIGGLFAAAQKDREVAAPLEALAQGLEETFRVTTCAA